MTRFWRVAIGVLGAVGGVIGIGALPVALAGPASPLAHVEWLAGCWERSAGDRWLEEQWMAPRGGMMVGMSRTVRGGRVVGYEALRIEEAGDGLVYVAHPSGQALAEFGSTVLSDTMAVFENAEHDFPQRILYRKGAGDSLFVRIEGQRGGEERGVDFRMARGRCPGQS